MLIQGEIVARAFDKFFNYGERGINISPSGKIKNVYEKIDGNLGVLYRDNGKYKISTREEWTRILRYGQPNF